MESIILFNCALVVFVYTATYHPIFRTFYVQSCTIVHLVFFTINNFDFLVYFTSGCCHSSVFVFLLFPLILMLKYFGVSCLVLHNLLNQMAAFVFSNISLVFLQLLQIFACWASIILIHVTCIFIIL